MRELADSILLVCTRHSDHNVVNVQFIKGLAFFIAFSYIAESYTNLKITINAYKTLVGNKKYL